ncbi:hypothetical protein EMQ25_13960 [Arsenicitalea aurantiaca]|uniref:DUF1127 domain-containing protein n=1 Tax=Arsenicitalea aurantiaca TaxID=1783274 RepID=A0A433X577_9HYPH|nr:hypothetical protein [Arsenicitalea aurantiaca]RUT29233.1 hypothetical protein EMQ25_13960 [Arsenicitalea aurantiaca]
MLQVQSMITTLSTCDYVRLEVLMSTLTGSRHATANLARRKLASAIVILPSELPCSTVSVGKRVRYRLDAEAAREQQLIWQAGESSETVSCLEPIGLALLGLKPSQTVVYPDESGQMRKITVERVTCDGRDTAKDTPGVALSRTVIAVFPERMWRELQRRLLRWLQSRARTTLETLNDNQLADIGVKRHELDTVAALIVASDPTADLQKLAQS